MAVHRRFVRGPRGSFFLFGPRGTGKSTWLRTEWPEALRFDLLDPETCRVYGARPERLKEAVLAHRDRTVVVIDEVQRVPELLPVVHMLIEEKLGVRFVLTGSSSRKLKRTGVDLLAGRLALASLHPFMAAELGKDFALARALSIGLLPLVVAAQDPESTLKGYASLYLNEEVKQEGLVRNYGDFARFLEAISFSHGSILNISHVARECQVDRKTVEGFVGIMEDLLLSFRLPVFTRRARRETAAHPKFYLFDAGVFRAFRPAGPMDVPSEIEGAAIEGLVAQHLRAWIAYGGQDHRLSYWRTRSGVEVDFVVYGKGVFAAIEVKNTTAVRPEALRGLRSFREDYPESRAIFLYRGRDRLLRDGILCLPVQEFLLGLVPGRPLPSA